MNKRKDFGKTIKSINGNPKEIKTDTLFSCLKNSEMFSLNIQERIKYGVITKNMAKILKTSLKPKIEISNSPEREAVKYEKDKYIKKAITIENNIAFFKILSSFVTYKRDGTME